MRVTPLWSVLPFVVLAGTSRPALALNYFELEVYPYETPIQGETEAELKMSYSRRGTATADAPDNNEGMTRSTVELSYGVTHKTELSLYGDFARPRGGDWSHAATRLHARTRFFEKGELPVDLGAYAEFAFPRDENNDLELELRGIVEKDLDSWTLDFNPIFEKVLKGTDQHEAWEFSYAAAAIYHTGADWTPRLELYHDLGSIDNFGSTRTQPLLLSPMVEYRLGREFYLNAGVAAGLTKPTEQQLLRAQLSWEF